MKNKVTPTNTAQSTVSQQDLRQVMRTFATGIAVMTAFNSQEEAVGITINSLTSVSLTPPLVLFCLDTRARLYPTFRTTPFFAVNILAEDQEAVSRHFANPFSQTKPARLWDKPKYNCPVLNGTLGWMVCAMKARHRGGDHDIFVGEVIGLQRRKTAKQPLLYFDGGYRLFNS